MKKANLLIALSLIAFCAQAEVLSPADALARVTAPAARRIAARSFNLEPEITVASHSNVPELYLFAPSSGGLLILSADSDAPALLGYSENYVAGQELPPALEMMLEGYSEEIEAIRQGLEPASASRAGSEDFAAIAPLCITTWNQLNPYNEQTPVINGSKTPTGCVATAMAQVLNIYKYPAKCSGGELSYAGIKGSDENISINFNNITLEWDKMLQKYTGSQDPQENRTAVATLMKALGYASRTAYGTSSSGASAPNMVTGLVNYFDYDASAISLDRSWFTHAVWEKKVYDELAAGYPIFYSGTNAAGGGHAFVVDGYKGDGLFHINWGWGGMSDGYFLLTALDPQQQGVGGSSAGYSLQNFVIFNLRPGKTTPYDQVPLTFFGTGGFKAVITKVKLGSTGSFAYTDAKGNTSAIYNRAPVNAVQPRQAIKLVAEDGTEYFGHNPNPQSAAIAPLYGLGGGLIQIPENLPDGTYMCSPQVWSAVTGKYYPVYFPVTNAYRFEATVAGGYITFSDPEAPSVKVKDVTAPDQIEYKVPFTVKGTVANTTDVDFTGKVCLGIYDEETSARKAVVGDVYGALEAGKSASFDVQLTLSTSLVSGVYNMAFFDSTTNKVISGYTKISVVCPTTLRVSKIACNSATKSNLEFAVNVAALDNDFDGQIYVEITTEGQTGYVDRFQSQPLKIAAKQSLAVTVGDEFKDGIVGKEYTARVYYWLGNNYTQATGNKSCTFTLTEGSAINNVEADAADAVFYDLSGRRVANPAKGGIYISKSRKIKF